MLGHDPQQVGPDELAIATGSASGFIQASLRTTTNPTVLTAGYKHNVIPDTAEALVDVRTLPGRRGGHARRDPRAGRPRHRGRRDAPGRRAREPVRRRRSIDAITAALDAHDPGARVLPYLLSGGTDNKALSKLGIAGYGFAPLKLPADLDFPRMFHGVDERVPLDALVFGRQVLTDFLLNY